MKTLGYYNGSYGELSSMYVPMLDRACYFGDGIYDVAYCYNHRAFALNEHVERFLTAAKELQMNFEMGREELCDLISRMTDKVEGDKLSIYFQLSRGTGIREHAFSEEMNPNVWIMIRPAELRNMTKGIKVMTAEDKRHGYCGYKTLNLLPNLLSFTGAGKSGFEEVVFHKNGRLTECAHSNVSLLKNGILYTPKNDGSILPGIGREHLLRVCAKINIPINYCDIPMEEVLAADEILLTAAGSLCIDVSEIDEQPVGGKDRKKLYMIRNALIDEFEDYTGGRLERGVKN